MNIRNIPLQLIKPYENNVKIHPIMQLESIVQSIRQFGFRQPLVIDKNNIIVAGHARYEAAATLGMENIPCEMADNLTDEQINAYRLLDNEIAKQGTTDIDKLQLELEKLPNFDFEKFNIDFPEFNIMNEGFCDEDEIPEPYDDPVTKLGDIYLLGNHRLMCGDATLIDHVEKLMAGEKADMAFTSPPYNLGSNSKLRGHNANGKDSAYIDKSDHKTESEYLDFLISFTNNALLFADTLFVNVQCLSGNKFVLPEYWHKNASRLIDIIIWDKEHAQPAIAERVLNSVWEFVFIFCNENRPTRAMRHGNRFRGTMQNIFRLNTNGKKDTLAKDHGAVFPVKFAEHFISSFSYKKVLDLFGGSGSTLIACEKTNRKCFMMEICPAYCDVIVKRWEKFSGNQAKLDTENN